MNKKCLSTVAACGRRGRATFSFLLCCILLPGVLGLAACNGNGGSKDSGGAVYSPGGGATGGTEDGKPSVSAEDLLNLSNSGWADEICALFPFGDDEPHQTFHISFSASELGVPEDGYVKLVITGGDEVWVGTVSVSADGIAYFTDIPMVRVGAKVSATMYGYAADGTLVSSGYDEGTTTEDGVLLHIGIIGPPTITLSGCTANGNRAPKDGTNYDVMEYPGTSPVMTVINANAASTMEVTINGVAASATTPLNDGFNKIVATVSRGNNPPVSATKYVYAVKALTEPTVTFPNGTHYSAEDSGDYEMWKYSYLAADNYDNLLMNVTNTYTGDNANTGGHSSMYVVVGGGGTYSDETAVSGAVIPDGSLIVSITVSKDNCEPVVITKYVTARIKPVTFTAQNLQMRTTWTDPGNTNEFYGHLWINGIDCGQQGKIEVSEPEDGSTWGGWSGWAGYSGTNAAFNLTGKTETETFEFKGWYEDDTGGGNPVSDVSESYTLEQLRYSPSDGYGYKTIASGGVQWQIRYTLSD